MPVFYVCKTHVKIFEIKMCLSLKKCCKNGWNVAIFTVKISLIAPTLGGRAPPDLYIGGPGPPLIYIYIGGGRAPLAPPVPTPNIIMFG